MYSEGEPKTMTDIIELKSDFIPVPPTLLYDRIMVLTLIGKIREKGQSAIVAEITMSEFYEIARLFGITAMLKKIGLLPLSENQKEDALKLKENIEAHLNTARFTTNDGRSFTIKLFDGIVCSRDGEQYKLKGEFSRDAREYIFNNRELVDENYDVLPTIQQGNNVGTILTARIPKDKVDELVAAEGA